MQVKAVEIAKSNSKSESIFQLALTYGPRSILVNSRFGEGRQFASIAMPS